jgi:hypothetical protein
MTAKQEIQIMQTTQEPSKGETQEKIILTDEDKKWLDKLIDNYEGRLATYAQVHRGLPEEVTHDKYYARHCLKQDILQWANDKTNTHPGRQEKK